MAACRLHSLSGQKPEAADYPRHYPLSQAPKDREYVGGLKDWRRIPPATIEALVTIMSAICISQPISSGSINVSWS